MEEVRGFNQRNRMNLGKVARVMESLSLSNATFVAEKDYFPLCLQRGKLTKKEFEELNYKYSSKKITSRSPQRFWRSVPIGVWSARDHFVPLTMRANRFPSRLVPGIRE